MRIGLNLLYLIPEVVGGTETYAAGLLWGLARVDTENQFILFVNRESAKWSWPGAANFTPVICPVSGVSRVRRYMFEQIRLPGLLRAYGVDVVHSLGYVGPLVTPYPSIVTIPDLNYVALWGFIPAGRRRVLRLFSTQAARRSTHVITISDFSKTEIVRLMGVPSDKITVTHLGPGWDTGQSDQSHFESIRLTYQLPDRYVVAFGGGSPHKNIPRLIAAFRQTTGEFPHSLVLLGHLPPNVDLSALRYDSQLCKRIVALGYVPREHIRPILGQADLYVLPSLYEGFGLPVLEAQSARVPVACGNVASLPEVAGDGAVFFDPMSVNDIAWAMRRILSDKGLQSSLRERGERNVGRFSWDNAARETLGVYRKVLSES